VKTVPNPEVQRSLNPLAEPCSTLVAAAQRDELFESRPARLLDPRLVVFSSGPWAMAIECDVQTGILQVLHVRIRWTRVGKYVSWPRNLNEKS
jgi:hypothetical protein